ncbi:MAG: DUF3526 domain-containing protein [Acidobacteria bacterium]|nr:DUF3526 domain-containing protein [Acidobacteriota bacterium]
MRKDLKEGIDGHAPADVRTKELEKKILAQYGVERLEDLPINFNGISLDASEQHANTVFDKHYAGLWRTYYAQEQIHKWTGIVSPLMPAKLLSMGMAGTDLRHTQHFTDSVEQYRRDFNRELNLYFAYNSSQKEGYNYFAGEEFWKTNLDFRYSQPGVFWALGWQISNLGLLLVWAIGALAIAVFAASRMGVD